MTMILEPPRAPAPRPERLVDLFERGLDAPVTKLAGAVVMEGRAWNCSPSAAV